MRRCRRSFSMHHSDKSLPSHRSFGSDYLCCCSVKRGRTRIVTDSRELGVMLRSASLVSYTQPMCQLGPAAVGLLPLTRRKAILSHSRFQHGCSANRPSHVKSALRHSEAFRPGLFAEFSGPLAQGEQRRPGDTGHPYRVPYIRAKSILIPSQQIRTEPDGHSRDDYEGAFDITAEQPDRTGLH